MVEMNSQLCASIDLPPGLTLWLSKAGKPLTTRAFRYCYVLTKPLLLYPGVFSFLLFPLLFIRFQRPKPPPPPCFGRRGG